MAVKLTYSISAWTAAFKKPYTDHWATCKKEVCATCCRRKNDNKRQSIRPYKKNTKHGV
jgi:hypothetical protein